MQPTTVTLRDHQWPRFLRGPDAQLLDALYVPALAAALRYDRCCAYFSSHVLAVAARGFGGFIENLQRLGDDAPVPAARLLVNEQLDPQDVDALLASGDQIALLADRLLRQLRTPQAALEKNRLAMLAWLVARGWLEVRVGVMRRGQGIVHAKFGVIEDPHGNRIAFSGSDNETGHALVENYEEVVVATDWNDAEFVAHYRERFATLWDDQDPYVTTLPLPEAVRQKLIALAPQEPPGEMAFDRTTTTATMLWHFIAAAPFLPRGELACDATAPVTPWPHQRHVVEDCARAFPEGRLLCDEVGMGKTIEAILILRRLMAGRGVRRALLLAPAGLLNQWQEELREKGGLLVPYWEKGSLVNPDGSKETVEATDALRQCAVLLISREWARLSGNREAVLSAPPWDLVLMDEAHAARRSAAVEREFNSANLLLQLLRELQLRRRTRGLLLLSATPMQTQPWEPWDLLTTLGIGGRWMVDFGDVRTFYNGIAALRQGTLRLPTAQAMGQLVATDAAFPQGPPHMDTATAQTIANSLTFCRYGEPRQRCAEWLRRGAPLGRRMHRNTRETLRQYHAMGLLSRPPAQRRVEDVVFDYQDLAERDCYEAITGYIDRRYDELEQEKGGKGFVMTIYRRRAASSPYALRCSLMNRIARLDRVIRHQWLDPWTLPEDEQVDERDLFDADIEIQMDPAVPSDPAIAAEEKREVESLLARLDALGSADSKFAEFWHVLQRLTSEGRSVLVFSEYKDTMYYLRDHLRPTYGKTLGCFSGEGGQIWDGQDWESVSKADVAKRLADGDLKVLVCTDAASEGLNLQAASAVINYDLPWNPSKVEQRIGRVDRIGQQNPQVLVHNMLLQDSVDMRVYQVLRQRCGLFAHFVGRMQPVLSMARQALRQNLGRDQVHSFIAQLETEADRVDKDPVVTDLFVESEAKRYGHDIPPVTLADMEEALHGLEQMDGRVRATRQDEPQTWRLYGLARSTIRVTLSQQTLESDASVLPLTASSDLLGQLTSKLPLTNRMPLVLAEHSRDGFRCMEACWVGADGVAESLQSAKRLTELLSNWDGTAPSAETVLHARQEALEAARRRVEALVAQTTRAEEAGLQHQIEAARRRLMRELGRTLRCMSHGDLNTAFRGLVQREPRADGRYHTALRLLGGYPTWEPEDIADANEFTRFISPKDRTARIAGSEIDAAIHDPRWLAQKEIGR